MPTGARARRSIDVGRIGLAVSQPGIDPRTWTTVGRVDDDPQAVRWVLGIGWIADVSFVGGPLDGETEVPCRVAGSISGSLTGDYAPLPPGCSVVVVLPSGNPEESPIIVGKLSNRGGCEAPVTVNDLPIIPGNVSSPSTEVTVSPFDTEIHVSEYNRREHYSGDRTTQAANQTVIADQEARIQALTFVLQTLVPAASIKLGSDLSTEAFVKGTTFAAALNTWLSAFATYISGIQSTADPPNAATPPMLTANGALIASLVPGVSLSQKIQGE